MKMKAFSLLMILGLFLTACSPSDSKETITFGTTAGIYAKVIDQALKPALEKQGYSVEVKTYVDLIEPNQDLADGEIDANLSQQKISLTQFNEQFNLPITALTEVPSVGLGLYSNSLTSMDDIPNGAWITIPNDDLGTARALRFLEQQGLLSLDAEASAYGVTEKQIDSNPKDLTIQPVLTSQLIASMASGDLAVIPDNFIMANEMELTEALAHEEISEELQYIVAVREEDQDKDFAQAIKKAAASESFKQVIEEKFQSFGK
ncbi:MetQ/NlpA family ABC transporter substrate-binding protein [Sporosarcina sp. P33]|uniref:MetQ/NlpA family ABC transporter substrate-binding protein n=1 Tax=Sporosarcina sp. P33 TaxID=1930764 RepID=UPI0009BD10C6|nr:MetQ/NlpA family ABC transporter substrate-binding protein [Sporosarcina sp. P33]ARD47291.1 hypothetical protein SporoP33_02830 [Sporosarcina sp. P33]